MVCRERGIEHSVRLEFNFAERHYIGRHDRLTSVAFRLNLTVSLRFTNVEAGKRGTFKLWFCDAFGRLLGNEDTLKNLV